MVKPLPFKRVLEERSYDVLRNDGLQRVVRAFRFHHPSFRTTLEKFIESVIDKSFD